MRAALPVTAGERRSRHQVTASWQAPMTVARYPSPTQVPSGTMVPDRSAPALLRAVGLLADGPVPWDRPLPTVGAGVYIVELGAPVATAPLELTKVGKWIELVPELRLDGERPTSKALMARLASFWLPSEPVLYIGSSTASVSRKVAAMRETVLGQRRPTSAGHWLAALKVPAGTRVWWSATPATEEYEDALLAAFADGVPDDDRAGLPDQDTILPFAVLTRPTGERKHTGLTGSLLPEPAKPAPKPITRIVDLPDADADGAHDEAKRARRPAPGRGAGRVASAAAYAAQGSPRKAPEETVHVSPEGLERLQQELAELQAKRPEVIARIATAREHGDLKENAEYHAAREEQGFLEGRIRSLEAKLRVAVVVEPTERGARVELGSRVKVEVDGDEMDVQVVGMAEADGKAGRISSASPVGAALLGRKVGDAVTVITPGGDVRYQILEVD
jgi:transcription elongation factor GreA